MPFKHSESHKCPELSGRGRKHKVLNFVQFGPFHKLLTMPESHIDTGASNDHLLHPLRPHSRNSVRHKPSVARPHHREPIHSHLLQQFHQASRLEDLRPLRGLRRRFSEEQQVGDVDIELGGEKLDLFPPLPESYGAVAMDQDQRRFLGVFVIRIRTPEVDSSLVVDFDGLRREAWGSEAASEVVGVEGNGAEKRGQHIVVSLEEKLEYCICHGNYLYLPDFSFWGNGAKISGEEQFFQVLGVGCNDYKLWETYKNVIEK